MKGEHGVLREHKGLKSYKAMRARNPLEEEVQKAEK